ncbi:MAG: FAD-binding protein [Saprospiraceae bacterium]|nr:FAD-binding protein [Saprospiraceae bacterium]
MKNWSGSIKWSPAEIAYPATVEAVQALVLGAQKSGRRIRMIGSAHSFVPLFETSDILVSLDKMQGVTAVNPEAGTLSVLAGTKLHLLGKLLSEQGLAQENLGDIDSQSIAGAISTGTHGTGLAFGNLATQVVGLQFVNGRGDLINCSIKELPALFQAARISLGAFGIITLVTLRVVPAFRLKMDRKKERLDEVLDTLTQRNRQNRHFEFYWFPYTKTVQTKTANVSQLSENGNRAGEYLNDVILENATFEILCRLAKWFPKLNRGVSRLSAKAISGSSKIRSSYQAFATPRYVRFNEMEYNVPLDSYSEVFAEIRETINSGRFNIHFPIENRFVKGDAIPLSPAFGRNSAYIALHVYRGKAFLDYFNAMESILLRHGGRPHWGKWHSREASYFKLAYPAWNDFLDIRNQQDPDGLFLNDYLNKIFGV